MRIHITTTPNEETVLYSYRPKLVGAIHKWLGHNSFHGALSLYSFSWLLHGKPTEKGFNFPYGAKMFISFHDETPVKQIIRSIMDDPEICFGMHVTDICIEDDPDLSETDIFCCATPILVKRAEEGVNDHHYTYLDPEADRLLTETIQHKMQAAGLPADPSLRIRFDTADPRAKIKVIEYRGIRSKASQCPVIIEGRPDSKLFVRNVGLGSSTGIGFGAVY
ncbi:MAG: CRISPR-associated endoribonuclease Cas6 [Prevotellaceae bacterium]|jgi:CRISPR-associated endoribonuclease Cas6|nr:CRISPR-associated endoribonuclease Cas6 [Prevotellaceae bacterium]